MDNTVRAHEKYKLATLGAEAPGRQGAKTQKYLDRKLISALYKSADGHYLGVSLTAFLKVDAPDIRLPTFI